MPEDLSERFKKYKGKGVIVDTNLLVAPLLAELSPRWREHDRCSIFMQNDLVVIQGCIEYFGPIFVTPHILTELCNLLDHFSELDIIRKLVEGSEECFQPSRSFIKDTLFCRLGLADVAVLSSALAEKTLFSAEQELVNHAVSRGGNALSLSEARELFKAENPIFQNISPLS